MASSAGNGLYASLDEMMKGGSVPESNNARPQKVKNVSPKGELSLNAAVVANKSSAKSSKKGQKGSASEPRRKTKKSDMNRMTEDSEFSSDASPHLHRRTPKTIPRTKVTAATPIEQKIALSRLKQKLDFDDNKENVDENIENNSAAVAARIAATNNNDAISLSSIHASEIQEGEISELNVSKINERMNQVRDYLKQATSIYVSLSVAGSHGVKDASRSEQMEKLAKLIQQLRVQETGYLDLLQKTNVEDKNSEGAAVISEVVDMTSTAAAIPTVAEINNAEAVSEFTIQKQELDRLKEQQNLLRKIVDQQKELQQLKERQNQLMQIQENAETLMKDKEEKEPLNNAAQSNSRQSDDGRSSDGVFSSDEAKRISLENKIKSLQDRKEEMDQLMSALRNVNTVEAKMGSNLNQDDLADVAAEVAAVAASFNRQDENVNEMNINEKITKLNDVRQRLSELKSLVADYELSNPNKVSTEASRDNRIQAQAMQNKEQKKDGNTVTGTGGARLRLPNVNNQDVVLNDLQALQKGIEELMDNRIRPAPKGREKKKIDVTRNPPSKKVKSKNTNQERGFAADVNEFEAFVKDLPEEYIEKMRELQLARQRLAGNQSPSDKGTSSIISATTQTAESEDESEAESTASASSALQWQEDPEFQTKVKKLQMAKEKLHHLQELVKVVQQGGGPNIPVNDLEDLTLSFSEDQDDSSAYGESEEEATEEDGEEEAESEEDGEEEEDEEDEEEDGEQSENEEEQSDVSKSTDMNFAPENGLSDNERRYQGLLRKQRLELNYLLKDRERLLEAQQKLSELASQPNAVPTQTASGSKSSSSQKKKNKGKLKMFPTLTEAELNKDMYKNSPKRNLFAKIEGLSIEPSVGSEHDSNQVVNQGATKVHAPLSNPMAVTEIRRQRELFEQKKKQNFVEKQRKKKLRGGDKNQSDDGATYSVHSDIDEGVGVSMYSADVTTAATWGGSTEQSSSEDSAVEEDYAANLNGGEEEYGSQFDQVEEEEEEAVGGDAPPIFKVKKYEEPRRGISWYQDEVRPNKKAMAQGNSASVSWLLDNTPPRGGKKKLRQGNLTPAHKLINDNRRKRLEDEYAATASNTAFVTNNTNNNNPEQPGGQLYTQLAGMCTSLLRNEQTLLSMLQNQTGRGNQDLGSQPVLNTQSDAYKNIQGFFATQYNEAFQQTLHSLRACYERVEQHQLDMEYLRQQFSGLNVTTTHPVATAADYRSPWSEAAPLHLSSFMPGNTTERKLHEAGSTTGSHAEQPVFQKETQTDTTLFEDPFKTSIQPYTLFGGDTSMEGNKSPTKKNDEDFNFAPNIIDAISPGAIGDRSFANQFEQEVAVPYRLRMSEYNPLSYQGNLPIAQTGNTVTMSRLSMKKEHAETTVTDGPERSIWPSFFKVAEATSQADNTSERSSKYTSSFAGQSAGMDEAATSRIKGEEQANESTKELSHTDFDRLRDSIYSEVATLIAMNEARPHYLIELFRELQLLNSDYLRQRSLFSLHELVTRFLTDDSSSPLKTAFKQETLPVSSAQSFENWVASTSEQTPSESALTTDEESESLALQTLARQIQNNEIYDYAELADSQSEGNISTPGSLGDAPFATENLGNTVINLDEALQKMKIYEQNMAKAKKTFEEISQNVRESTPYIHQHFKQNEAIEAIKCQISNTLDNISNSSAGDVTSETSSDMPQPSFDTQKLDRQIKSVMRDLIPFLNEHIESICNEELLDEIRNLIVHYAKMKEPSSEKEQFGKFFHTQLDSILRGSLMKFNSRKLKECGEDILIDVSEILFNELSFFKLMQDLNRPLHNGLTSETYACPDGDSGSHSKMPFLNQEKDENTEDECTGMQTLPVHAKSASHSSTSSSNTYVVVDPATDITDDETESQRQYVNVELSVCETRPIRSSGSGEDDHDEEPSTFSKVSVPASSILQYSTLQSSEQQQQATGSGGVNNQEEVEDLIEGAVQEEGDENQYAEDDRDEGDQDEDSARRNETEDVEAAQGDRRRDEESDGEVLEDERSEHERSAPEVEMAVMENESAEDQRDLDDDAAGEGESEAEGQGDTHQDNDPEEGLVAEDDLPEADMATEEAENSIVDGLLRHMDGREELAGDPNAIPPMPGNGTTD